MHKYTLLISLRKQNKKQSREMSKGEIFWLLGIMDLDFFIILFWCVGSWSPWLGRSRRGRGRKREANLLLCLFEFFSCNANKNLFLLSADLFFFITLNFMVRQGHKNAIYTQAQRHTRTPRFTHMENSHRKKCLFLKETLVVNILCL